MEGNKRNEKKEGTWKKNWGGNMKAKAKGRSGENGTEEKYTGEKTRERNGFLDDHNQIPLKELILCNFSCNLSCNKRSLITKQVLRVLH